MAHLEIGTFGESQGYLAFRSNYLEDGAKGVSATAMSRLESRLPHHIVMAGEASPNAMR